MKKGFTLIELLVVVLIIGILSAIALPQYQKAVEKSRVTEGLIQGKALLEAIRLHQLATGEAIYTLEGLDYEMPEGWNCKPPCKLAVAKTSVGFEVSAYFGSAPSLWCWAKDKSAGKICESFGGIWNHQGNNTEYYLIEK